MIEKYLTHPDQYYPEDNSIMDAIKWHIALMELIDRKRSELNPDLHRSGQPVPMGEIKVSDEIRNLVTRDRSFFSMMKYEDVAMIEAAMMVGRELWYRKNCGFSDYNEELATTVPPDLETWAEIFDIPLTEEEGGNLTACIDYTLSKRADFLQCYVDACEEYWKGVEPMKSERCISVDGQMFLTEVKRITGANLLEIEAGTNGFKGGDGGHGSRTFIRISDGGGTEWKLHKLDHNNGSLIIEMAGDSELLTIIDAFREIVKILEGQIAGYQAEKAAQATQLQDLIAEQREQL